MKQDRRGAHAALRPQWTYGGNRPPARARRHLRSYATRCRSPNAAIPVRTCFRHPRHAATTRRHRWRGAV
ncbi:MAG: hypothetical protein ACK56F_12125, partial [bacterium]